MDCEATKLKLSLRPSKWWSFYQILYCRMHSSSELSSSAEFWTSDTVSYATTLWNMQGLNPANKPIQIVKLKLSLAVLPNLLHRSVDTQVNCLHQRKNVASVMLSDIWVAMYGLGWTKFCCY